MLLSCKPCSCIHHAPCVPVRFKKLCCHRVCAHANITSRVHAHTNKSDAVVQLRVNYPSNILTVASESDCLPGADWPASSLTFVCNARGSSDSVLMNSILQPPYRSQQGSNISIASVTFKAVSDGSGALTVDILGMAQQDGTTVSVSTPAVAAAGNVSPPCMPLPLWLQVQQSIALRC